MTRTAARSQFAAAVRARAIALSRARLPLFASLVGLLVALWTFVLVAVATEFAGRPQGSTGPGSPLMACTGPLAPGSGVGAVSLRASAGPRHLNPRA